MPDIISAMYSVCCFLYSHSVCHNITATGISLTDTKKSTVLVSLVNAIILLIAVGAIVIESFYKLKHPEATSGEAISWTAGIGILVNGITAWL